MGKTVVKTTGNYKYASNSYGQVKYLQIGKLVIAHILQSTYLAYYDFLPKLSSTESLNFTAGVGATFRDISVGGEVLGEYYNQEVGLSVVIANFTNGHTYGATICYITD